MSKISKIIFSTVAAFSLIASLGGANLVKANEQQIDDTRNLNSDVSTSAIQLRPGQLASLGFKVISYVSNTWLFHREANEYIGPNSIEVNSGTIGFNDKDSGYGASIKHDVEIDRTSEQISTFAQTDPFNMILNKKISVIITDSNNNDVVSKTVTHGQYVLHNPSRTGTHTVRYVTQEKLKWDIYITLRNWQINPSAVNNLTVLGVDGKEIPALLINGKIYVYPSDSHQNSFEKFKKSYNENFLSLADLQDQVYDNEIKRTVSNFRDFNIGDSIYFADAISSLRYDLNNNYTLFGFEDKEGYISEWIFEGDLTTKYNVGDTLKLKLNVVEDTNGFETIDLIKNFQASEGIAESIEKYLISE